MRTIFLRTGAAIAFLAAPGHAMAGTAAVDANGDIIVTGEKAARTLQETTTSIAVTTPQRIREENIITIQDVYQRTANVTETYGAFGFTIRGIANNGVSGGGNAALATVYVDNAALPSSVLLAAPTDMWDVAQVEILRGPQSTLQGLNSLAGAVIIQTAEPTQEWELRGRAMYTNADESQFAIAAGGPIARDELAFRVSIDKRDADGFIRNTSRNTGEDSLDSTNIRAKLLWTPSALPGFEARIGYNHYDRKGAYRFSYTDISVPDFYDNRTNSSNDPNDSRSNTDIATLDLRYDIGSGLALTSVTTYNDIDERNRYDNDGTAADEGAYRQSNRYKTFSQELRLNYEGNRLSGLFGLFYYDRKQHSTSISHVGVPTPLDTISLLLQGNGLDADTSNAVAALYGAALPVIPVDFVSDDAGRVKTFAVFGDGRYKLTDRLTLMAGFRYDREKNRIGIDQVTTFAGTFPDPAAFGAPGTPLNFAIEGINAGVAAIVAQASGGAAALDRTFEAFLPKAGIEMAWTNDLRTAFTVQRGYRSGGSSTNTARSTTVAYDPEYTWNYELSLRSAWLDGALTVNANAFYVDWKDQQVSVNFGLNVYDFHTVNAGKSHLYGFEVETAYRVSPAFDLYAAIGHTRTKFDDFTVTTGSSSDLSGLEFPYAPHWTLSGGFNARFADRIHLNVNASHRSPVFADTVSPQSSVRLESRTLVNARISYQADHWGLSAFASNLFDEKYRQYAYPTSDQAVLGNPRVFGLILETRW